MCGIFGSPNITPEVRRMLPYLAQAMENRGRHAWGASDGTSIIRRLGAISKTWYEEYSTGIESWSAGIFHTRLASEGAHDVVENAHPFSVTGADGRTLIGIHNGQIYNHRELNHNHSRSCSVDSEHLWLHRAAGLPWKDLRGYAALAWWEKASDDAEPVQYLCRINSQFLTVARVEDGGLVWASTRDSLEVGAIWAGTSLTEFYTLREGGVYILASDGRVLLTDEEVEFGVFGNHSGCHRNTDSADMATILERRAAFSVVPGGSSAPPFDPTVTTSPPTTQGSIPSPMGPCYSCTDDVGKPGALFCEQCFQELVEGYHGSVITEALSV